MKVREVLLKLLPMMSVSVIFIGAASCNQSKSSKSIIDPGNLRTDLLKLKLISPSRESGTQRSIQIEVNNTTRGEKIRLFTDEGCTEQIAMVTAQSRSTLITAFIQQEGRHQIRAKSSNSGCSESYVEYFYVNCPENYSFIHKNSDLGTINDFCVSKYEMKCEGSACDHTNTQGIFPGENAVAVSVPQNSPWSKLSQADAKLACDQLGEQYDLISNPEWMTIAYEIENNPANWTSGVVGEEMLFRGHSDGFIEGDISGGALEASVDEEPYFKTGNNLSQLVGSGKEQKRTLVVESGDVIWDFSGNLWEWTNWELDENLLSAPDTCDFGSLELPIVDCNSLLPGDYLPSNPAGIQESSYNSTYGLGVVFGGTAGSLVRGGISSSGEEAGIFSFGLNFDQTLKSAIIGFRCVYRPSP